MTDILLHEPELNLSLMCAFQDTACSFPFHQCLFLFMLCASGSAVTYSRLTPWPLLHYSYTYSYQSAQLWHICENHICAQGGSGLEDYMPRTNLGALPVRAFTVTMTRCKSLLLKPKAALWVWGICPVLNVMLSHLLFSQFSYPQTEILSDPR